MSLLHGELAGSTPNVSTYTIWACSSKARASGLHPEGWDGGIPQVH